VLAIFCIDPMEGETSPFSSCEMKLAENPVRVPRARAEIPAFLCFFYHRERHPVFV